MVQKSGEAVIFGAGKIGRGFLAEILDNAGYHLNFIENDADLVRRLQDAKKYSIHKITNESHQTVWIAGFSVYHSQDAAALSTLVERDGVLLAIAVHQNALPQVAASLVPGLVARAAKSPASNLDIVLCVNMTRPAPYFGELLRARLPTELHQYMDEHIGLVETVVMRICPETPAEMLAADPLAIMTNGYPEMPIHATAFRGSIPSTPMLRLVPDIKAEEVRKIYMLNMAHAMAAYMGAPLGYATADEAICEPGVRAAITAALAEAGAALAAEYGYNREEMARWGQSVVHMLENRSLHDRLDRLGFDPSRKLSRNDRLVGPALLCLKHGIVPDALAGGIAHGLRFRQPGDEGARLVQETVQKKGIGAAIGEICGVTEQSLLTLIMKHYQRLAPAQEEMSAGD